MSEEEKKTEDKPSEKSSSGYKGKGSNNDNRPKRGPPLSPAQQRRKAAVSYTHLTLPTTPYV